jgi:tetratricopeptide (TPR) repeat protein
MYSVRAGAVGLAVLASTLLASGCGGAQSRFESHMDRGNKYMAAGDYAHAGIEYRNAMQILPKDLDARLMTARLLEKQGKVGDALKYYQSVVDSNPDNVQARASVARIFAFAGDPEQAAKVLQPGLQQQPDNPDLLAVRAATRQQLNDSSGAMEDAERAFKLAPTSEDSIALLAGLYSRQGDKQRAVEVVSEGVRRIPSSVDLRQVLASLYVDIGQPAQAEQQLRKLIELQPKVVSYRNELASLLLHQHNVDGAQQVLEQAVTAMPERTDAKLNLVDFVATQRGWKSADTLLRQYIEREPKNYPLQLGLGSLLQSAGEQQKAITAYQAVVSKDERGASGLRARDKIAVLLLMQGKADEAQRLIAEVLKSNPRDSDALALRAEMSLRRGDANSAIADLRAVIRDQPKSLGYRLGLARAYRAHGEPALAEETLRAAMDIAPNSFDVRIDLAELLSQLDRAPEAIKILEAMVHQEPTDPRPRALLSRVYLAKGDFAQARQSAEDFKTLRPKSPIGFYEAGLVAQAEGRLADGEREFDRALELKPDDFDVLSARSRLDVRQGHVPQAITRVQGASERNPKDPQLVALLGELYFSAKDYANAVRTDQQAIELAPRRWVSYRDLATVKLAQQDKAGAVAAYEAGAKAIPGEIQLLAPLTDIYVAEGRIDDAISSYETAYHNAPGSLAVANNLAMLLVNHRTDQRDLDRAKELTAPFATSLDASLLDTHGWVKFKRGEYQEALQVLERAVATQPESPVIRYHLAMAQIKSGQEDKARTNLQTALGKARTFEGSEDARLALVALKGSAG